MYTFHKKDRILIKFWRQDKCQSARRSLIAVAVSWPEEATSGLAKLLPVERQPLPVWQKPQILPSELAGQQSEPKASRRQKSTPGDQRRRIFTSRWTGSSMPVVGWRPVALCASLLATVLFCSLAVLDPRVGHTMDVLSPFIAILCHSHWLFQRESCPRHDVLYRVRAWSSSPACTWHCSLHYFFLQAIPLFPHGVTIVGL